MSYQEVITVPSSTGSSWDTSFQQTQETLERWTNRGSGWVVDRIDT